MEISNKIKKHADEVIQYMLGNKRKGMCLTYSKVVRTILEYTGYNFWNESFKEKVKKIGETTLAMIRYKIIDRKFIEKASHGKKRKKEDQEAPIN